MDDMLFVAKRKAEDARVRGGVYSHYISWMICCVSPSASKAEDAMRGCVVVCILITFFGGNPPNKTELAQCVSVGH